MENLYVSQDGLDKLKKDLAACHGQRLIVADAIERARGYGDLRENADYHAAKEAQALLAAQIRDLEDKLTRAVVVDSTEIDTSKAYLGAIVRVRNLKTSREIQYRLVSPVETDLAHGKISVKSPVGQALLGHSVGESVVATVPAGDIPMEIIEIRWE